MILAGCTHAAVVCDDTGTSSDWRLVAVQLMLLALLAVSAVVGAVLVRRRVLRRRRPATTRVWISADGEVVRRDLV